MNRADLAAVTQALEASGVRVARARAKPDGANLASYRDVAWSEAVGRLMQAGYVVYIGDETDDRPALRLVTGEE